MFCKKSILLHKNLSVYGNRYRYSVVGNRRIITAG